MMDISVIIPVKNGEKWIESCMKSIAEQTAIGILQIEIVAYNDGSEDKTKDLLHEWSQYFSERNVKFITVTSMESKGVGAAKNGAVRASCGEFLCFQDIDDIMLPDRLLSQWEAAKNWKDAIVGCKVVRHPPNSTLRFTNWANNLSHEQLKLQIYTSHGPTLLMPTWFCHRNVFDKVGGFDQSGHGTPEDLLFFYSHLAAGGELYRVDKSLVVYTYHEGATTFSVDRHRIWEIQIKRMEKELLPKWISFTVWNAGKAGRKLVRCLKEENKKKVIAFCDVDQNKIGKDIELYCKIKRKVIMKVPVIHFSEAKPPFLICVKLDLTGGDFEKNLSSINLKEGIDYYFCN